MHTFPLGRQKLTGQHTMKKINLQNLAWAVSVLLVAIFIYSCKRDSGEAMSELNQALIGKAKQFYQRETINFESRNRYVLSSEKTGSKAEGNINVNPIWEKAAIETSPMGKKLITIPIPDFDLDTKTSAYARKMVFETRGETITEGQIFEVFSSPSEISANGDQRVRDAADGKLTGFTGAVMTYNLNYFYKEGRYYENGVVRDGIAKIVKGESLRKEKLALPGSANISGGIGKLAFTPGSISAITPEFEGQDCENFYLVYIERDEFGNIVYWENRGYQYTKCKSTNPDGPNPGGSSTEVYVDCNRDILGNAYVDVCEECVGGNTGLEPCYEVRDNLNAYPCAKNLVKQLTTLKTDISNLIKNAFGKNDKTNVFFEADPTLAGGTIDGHQNGFNQYTSNGVTATTYKIGLNPDVLNNATKEYILVTLYHEALHAYLAEKKRVLGAVEFNNQFGGLIVNGGRLIGIQDPQHWPMGYANFVNGMRDAILAFNPTFPPDRAYAMAIGGVMSLSPSQATMNAQERNTSQVGYVGTKCP